MKISCPYPVAESKLRDTLEWMRARTPETQILLYEKVSTGTEVFRYTVEEFRKSFERAVERNHRHSPLPKASWEPLFHLNMDFAFPDDDTAVEYIMRFT